MKHGRPTPSASGTNRLRRTVATLRRPTTGACALVVALAAAITLSSCSSSGNTSIGSSDSAGASTSSASRTITDTAGRTVKVPAKITRVATVGTETTLDSMMYVIGAQDMLVDGIPSTWGDESFLAPYRAIAPRLLQLPSVQPTVSGNVDKEKLLSLNPDLVLASSAEVADEIQKLGIPTIVPYESGTGQAMEHDVTLLGKVLNREKEAQAYVSYFEDLIDKAHQGIAGVPAADRPSGIYLNFDPLTQPTAVEGWIFSVLGVNNVIKGTVPGHFAFTNEQLLAWNPDYIVCQMPTDLPKVTQNSQFAPLTAVKKSHVDVIPSGLNIWGDNTLEMPLGLLWTEKFVYPQQFADVDLAKETASFYSTFFHVTLSDSQIAKLIKAGGFA